MSQADSESTPQKPPKKSRYKPVPGVWVDIKPVREHILHLRELGWTYRRMSQASGVSANRFGGYVDGTQTRVMVSTADRILALTHETTYADDERHLPWPTQRRIGALLRRGWPLTVIAEEAGLAHAAIDQLMEDGERRQFVSSLQVVSIQVAYDKLHELPGPRDQSRWIARRKGWPPPQAYEDGELDDLEFGTTERVAKRWAKQEELTPGERLFDLIEAADYTLFEFADKIEVPKEVLNRWVGDRSRPRAQTYRRMCDVLGVQELPVKIAGEGIIRPSRATAG